MPKNINKTPLLQLPRKAGGTLYVFPSAQEDIGLNLNYRTNSVELSHYALLNLPQCDTRDSSSHNRFNVTRIPGHFDYLKNAHEFNDDEKPAHALASSLQNYAMNFETLLLNNENYQYSDLHTVSERVFWKWLKETGAILWDKSGNSSNAFEEGNPGIVDFEYETVVKCFGTIDAGNSASSQFGMYNETYINIPTSYGDGPVFFKVCNDENEKNYVLGKTYACNSSCIEGRDPSTDESFMLGNNLQAFSDKPCASTGKHIKPWAKSSNASPFYETEKHSNGSPLYQCLSICEDGNEIGTFYRSCLDGIEIIKDINEIKQISDEYSSISSFDDININMARTGSFEFNAILLYYTVHDANSTSVCTNLFGILFLDYPRNLDDTLSGDELAFKIDTIIKKKSTSSNANDSIGHGFGTGYSFRINVKTCSIYDNTDATINDNTTSNSLLAQDWSSVVKVLNNAIQCMNVNVDTTKAIQDSYAKMLAMQNNNDIRLNDLSTLLMTYINGRGVKYLEADKIVSPKFQSADSSIKESFAWEILAQNDTENNGEDAYAEFKQVMSLDSSKLDVNGEIIADSISIKGEENIDLASKIKELENNNSCLKSNIEKLESKIANLEALLNN